MSKRKCCVPGCMDSDSSHKTMHSFPNPEKDRKRFNQWVFSIGGSIIRLDNDDIYKLRRVCHAHFEEKYCCRLNRLSNIAVPTLNLPGSLSLRKFTFEEKRSSRPIQNSTQNISSKDIIHKDHNYYRADMVYHNYPRTYTIQDPAAPGTHKEFNFESPPEEFVKALLPPFLTDDKAQPVELTKNEEPEPTDIEETVEKSFVDDQMQCEEVSEEPVQIIGPFTWQQPSAVVPCDADTLEKDHTERELTPGDEPGHSGTTSVAETLELERDFRSPVQETSRDTETPEKKTHALYQCNVCEQHIHGFRYACVQCADFDLCGACEGAGRHPTHYVLRVPPDKTKGEVKAILQTIRCAVTNCIIHLNEGEIEVKEETDQEDPIAVGIGVPYSQGPMDYTEEPMVPNLVPDICNASDEILYLSSSESEENTTESYYKLSPYTSGYKRKEKSNVKVGATVSPKQAQTKPSNVTLQLERDDSGSFLVTTQTTKAINTLQLREKYKNTSDTQVVTVLEQCVNDMYVNTSSVNVVKVRAQCVNPSTGASKRSMLDKVTGNRSSPERKKVATVHIQRLTNEEMKAALHKS